jgi:hypothetical protein
MTLCRHGRSRAAQVGLQYDGGGVIATVDSAIAGYAA